jgi:excisionase family DNA binding protein
MSKKSSSQLLGSTFVARALGVAENTARKLLDDNVIPSQRDASGRRLVKRDDLDAYLRRRGQAECA